MFNQVGSKIKTLAAIAALIGILGSVICGAAILVDDPIGIVIIIAGPLVSWLSTLTLYGFGELVENSGIIVAHLHKTDTEKDRSNASKIVAQDEWKCGCGRVNKTYITTCVCGRRQFEEK